MTKRLIALLVASTTLTLVFAGASPASAEDPKSDEETTEEVSPERLGESPITTEDDTATEKTKDADSDETEEDESSWKFVVVYIGDIPVMAAPIFFYDPDGDVPIDEPGRTGGKDRKRPSSPSPDIVLQAH